MTLQNPTITPNGQPLAAPPAQRRTRPAAAANAPPATAGTDQQTAAMLRAYDTQQPGPAVPQISPEQATADANFIDTLLALTHPTITPGDRLLLARGFVDGCGGYSGLRAQFMRMDLVRYENPAAPPPLSVVRNNFLATIVREDVLSRTRFLFGVQAPRFADAIRWVSNVHLFLPSAVD